MDDLLLDSFIWVKLKDEGSFLKVRETLSRIGIYSSKDNTLVQSCHILHKQGKYAIVHFKELFSLDGKTTDFTENDRARRNTIANLLADWELLTLEYPAKSADPVVPINQIKILPYKDKDKVTLVQKYSIGKHKRK